MRMDVTQSLTTEAQRTQRGHRENSLHPMAICYSSCGSEGLRLGAVLPAGAYGQFLAGLYPAFSASSPVPKIVLRSTGTFS